DTVRIYYGAADTSIALATGSLHSMLDWLEEHK
ncbi:MAG: glycosidase, partial [Anaerolineaceae bacterium]|nr:glycosidase [Anaerolineaceae bacterium]